MEPSVSPLPIPLWPMLALSLALFCATTIAVTLSARQTQQLSASSAQTSLEVVAPLSLENGQYRVPLAARDDATERSVF